MRRYFTTLARAAIRRAAGSGLLVGGVQHRYSASSLSPRLRVAVWSLVRVPASKRNARRSSPGSWGGDLVHAQEVTDGQGESEFFVEFAVGGVLGWRCPRRGVLSTLGVTLIQGQELGVLNQ